MFATVQLPTTFNRQALAVPVGAIQQLDGKTVVFVRRAATQFETREIKPGKTVNGQVEVLAGLREGEPVVTVGRIPPEVHHRGQGPGGGIAMERLVAWALSYRFIVLLATVFVVAVGLYSLQKLPIDAVPDITPNQVLVLTRAPSLSPLEVEKFLTFPVETAMSGLPGIEKIQSVSKFGLSYVAVYFKEDMDPYFCRRLVMERLPQAARRSCLAWARPKWVRSPPAWARSTCSR